MRTSQVFISHTSDMAEFPAGRSFVQAALDAVNRAGMAPVDMRYFAAREGRPADYCRERVSDCEIYVAVVGLRYGSVVPGGVTSYTELEFETASKAGLPRLVFLLADAARLPASLTDADRTAVDRFRLRLRDAGLVVRAFASDAELELELFHALTEVSGTALPVSAVSGQAVLEARYSLPPDTGAFTGRDAELESILTAAARPAWAGGVAAVRAIDGMPGVGKTALAVHAAHVLAGQFPDGQLFVDLHGHTEGYRPRTPRAALHGFLTALGVSPQQIPPGLEARAALYRERVAGTRTLVLLDNASSEAQVRPLIPSSAGCMVLVTSRRRLKALDHADVIPLEVPAEPDAITLFRAVAGAASQAASEALVAEVISLCGRLPLAVRIAAALIRHRPAWPLEHLITLLRDPQHRIAQLADGERDLTGVFSLSYAHLTEPQRQLFSYLGLIPGPDFDAHAAASLTGTELLAARGLLEDLVDHNLLAQPVPGRYQPHDLIRLYAQGLARKEHPEEDRQAALRRLVDFYLHTAHAGDRILHPSRSPVEPGAHAPGCCPRPLSDKAGALEWFDAEHLCLRAAQQAAAAQRWHRRVWHLAWALDTFHYRRGHLNDELASWQAALAAAEHLEDPNAKARAHRLLGNTYGRAGRHPEALGHLQQALALAQEARDLPGQAHTRTALAIAWESAGDNHQALEHATVALHLHRALSDPVGEAEALNATGWYAARLGRHEQARASCEAALALCRQHDYRDGEAATLDSLGYIAHAAGQHDQALEHYRQALALIHDLGDTFNEPDILDRIGQSHYSMGRRGDAREAWQQALAMYQALDRAAESARVRRQLAVLEENSDTAER